MNFSSYIMYPLVTAWVHILSTTSQ